MVVSIQSQILVPNPIVNEPGYDSREGSAQSKEYNAKLRLDTMRHGMLAQLRRPPVGFESAVAAHFARGEEALAGVGPHLISVDGVELDAGAVAAGDEGALRAAGWAPGLNAVEADIDFS